MKKAKGRTYYELEDNIEMKTGPYSYKQCVFVTGRNRLYPLSTPLLTDGAVCRLYCMQHRHACVDDVRCILLTMCVALSSLHPPTNNNNNNNSNFNL